MSMAVFVPIVPIVPIVPTVLISSDSIGLCRVEVGMLSFREDNFGLCAGGQFTRSLDFGFKL
ncbi:Protein of unknown function [Pyronema omphalodes CBS 100304]|uniref:Uncharacterized protein n=1 Tax=Pyronema omphalodes (strain CBS 100304) TaxID=1076935 RepID=U4LRN8_PYROM|nr:Protein of unknown function [Pyronema omphalodes CBS 100304]